MTRTTTTINNDDQRAHTQQPATPYRRASYWTRKSPFELRLKLDADAMAQCSSVRVPYSDGTLYPTRGCGVDEVQVRWGWEIGGRGELVGRGDVHHFFILFPDIAGSSFSMK
jgi:hypothetical protein